MKYEYFVQNRDQAEKTEFVNDLLNEMGSQGWRLAIVSDWFFAWEREVPIIPTYGEAGNDGPPIIINNG